MEKKTLRKQPAETFCIHNCRNACALLNDAMKRESEMVKFYDQILAECDYPDIHGFVRELSEERSKAILRIVEKVNEMPSLDKIYIDVGATGKKDCPVQVGDVAVDRPYTEMGNRLVAKSMDDRVGVLVAMETLRALKTTPHDVYFVFTTQEEVGVRGAATSAFGMDPDIGISIDVTHAADTPHAARMEMARGNQNQQAG